MGFPFGEQRVLCYSRHVAWGHFPVYNVTIMLLPICKWALTGKKALLIIIHPVVLFIICSRHQGQCQHSSKCAIIVPVIMIANGSNYQVRDNENGWIFKRGILKRKYFGGLVIRWAITKAFHWPFSIHPACTFQEINEQLDTVWYCAWPQYYTVMLWIR